MGDPFRIEVEGLREFNFAVRRATDTELPKRLGQANKSIGQLVISKLEPRPDPTAVGEGRGAAVRASASKRDVTLRVGGAHRAGEAPEHQWGRVQVFARGRRTTPRPNIIGTSVAHYDEISDAYLRAITGALSGAFASTDP